MTRQFALRLKPRPRGCGCWLGGAGDRASVSGDVNAKNASVVFQTGKKVTAVASIGRNLENLKAELALERGDEFHAS